MYAVCKKYITILRSRGKQEHHISQSLHYDADMFFVFYVVCGLINTNFHSYNCCTGNIDNIMDIKRLFSENLDIKDLDIQKSCFIVLINQSGCGMILSHTSYIFGLLSKYGKEEYLIVMDVNNKHNIKITQFIHKPCECRQSAPKRLLKYFGGTIVFIIYAKTDMSM